MVAKIFRDPSEDRASYFKDVEMQMQAKEVAERFNRRNPPKKVPLIHNSKFNDRSSQHKLVTHSRHLFIHHNR